jgi:hypothetical protein
MRHSRTVAALIALAPLAAACVTSPAPRLTEVEGTGLGPCETAALSPANRTECRKVMAEVAQLDSVTLEFSDRYQAVAAPIQIWTRSWVTHVDFVLPDGRLLGATPFGVRIRNWTPPLHAVRYSFKADPSQVYGFALAQLGKRYNYIGNIGYALKSRALHDDGAWFCSELVQASAQAAGVDLSGTDPRWTSPARIKASRLLTIVAPSTHRLPPATIAASGAQPEG